MANKLPERVSAGGMLCPKCRRPALQYIEATSEWVCTNCGFKQPIRRA